MKTIYCDFQGSYRYRFSLSLNDRSYEFTITWNEILQCFFLDMTGNKTQYSIPLASGMVKTLDTNAFVMVEKGEDHPARSLSIDSLNEDYFLMFADENDL